MSKAVVLLDQYGQPLKARRSPAGVERSARYDAAQTTDENYKHWREADGLAPTSQLTPEVRRTLRNRARYEVQNNAYAQGLVRTLVGDTVGTGPRLQMLTDDPKLNEAVEDHWRLWACTTNLALNLRVMAGVRYVAGECFAVFRDSKALAKRGYPVTLDLRLIEPEQVADPYGYFLFRPTGDDGIVCDDEGEVVTYKILRRNPGDLRAVASFMEADDVPAENVLQWFQPDRPGQLRGVTPLAPALGIFAQLRRFTQATLTSAEVAAMMAGVMESDLPPHGDPAVTEEKYFDLVEMVRGMLLTLPPGVKLHQFKPEQPTTNYEMFVNAKLRECGRVLNVPFGKWAGDHSRYNYSSGRLDDAGYWTDRTIERQELEAKTFDPLFWRWCDFAKFAIPRLAMFAGSWWQLRHAWHYDARPSSDPVKDAAADAANLTNGSDTLAAIAARDGTTAEALLLQRSRDKALFDKYGLPYPPWLVGAPVPAAPADGPPPQQEVPANAA